MTNELDQIQKLFDKAKEDFSYWHIMRNAFLIAFSAVGVFLVERWLVKTGKRMLLKSNEAPRPDASPKPPTKQVALPEYQKHPTTTPQDQQSPNPTEENQTKNAKEPVAPAVHYKHPYARWMPDGHPDKK